MQYSAAETPTGEPLTIINTPAVLFAADTMASFEGKPVTIQHPDARKGSEYDVDPSNWAALAKGIIQSVRPGHGEDADKLIGDLIITDLAAIALVKSKDLREISAGYVATLLPSEDGKAIRTKIIGNHAALVTFGRAGSEVAIRDHKPTEGNDMQDPKKKSLIESLKSFLGVLEEMPTTDADPSIEVEVENAEEEEMASADSRFADYDARLADMESKIAALIGEKEMQDKCKDAKPEDAKLADSATVAIAEIIAPGIENTADIKAESLRFAMKSADAKPLLDAISGGKEINFESAEVVDVLFHGLATALTEQRKSSLVKAKMTDAAPATVGAQAMSPERLNELNAQHWANRKEV